MESLPSLMCQENKMLTIERVNKLLKFIIKENTNGLNDLRGSLNKFPDIFRTGSFIEFHT